MIGRAIFRGVVLGGAIAALGLISYAAFLAVKYEFGAPAVPNAAPIAFEAAVDPEVSFTFHETPLELAELRFTDAQGRARSLDEFSGKLILLNIWATWCTPCRREMPTLERLQTELGGPDFEVLALSIDRQGASVVAEFYRELGLEALAVYVDASSDALRSLGIIGVPTTLLIDRKGREVARLVGPAEWDSPEMIAFFRARVGGPASPRAATPARTEQARAREKDN